MTVRHVVRCDECEVEADLIYGTIVPSNWKQCEGWHFCSWSCMARYAEAQAKRTEER